MSASPLRICERITPELPRAPISDPWLMASHTARHARRSAIRGAAVALGRRRDSTVSAMFVPVSPSGTG